jgi:hypothetical protein
MSEENWYDEGPGSVSFHRKTMKSYNAYTPPSIDSILNKKEKPEIPEEDLKLAPCPFCGSIADMCESGEDGNWDLWNISCNDCYGQMETNTRDKSQAIREWNTRPAPNTELIEALERYDEFRRAKISGKCIVCQEPTPTCTAVFCSEKCVGSYGHCNYPHVMAKRAIEKYNNND